YTRRYNMLRYNDNKLIRNEQVVRSIRIVGSTLLLAKIAKNLIKEFFASAVCVFSACWHENVSLASSYSLAVPEPGLLFRRTSPSRHATFLRYLHERLT
ncbi:MAG: hypothetical protein ACOYOU_03890, partial [Kiritimatiellia bacterium]